MFGGIKDKLKAKEWIEDGKRYDFIEKLTEGDFFSGVDKDLIPVVHPVLNYKTNAIRESQIRIDTGNEDINKVA